MATVEAPTVTVGARVPRELRDDLDCLVKATGRNRNTLVEEADAGDIATTEEVEATFCKFAAYRDQDGERRAG